MVSLKSVEKQLKSISFNHHAWGKAEAEELPNILLADETIFECVNGFYEGGFALLCATDVRLLLIDKKPFKFLTVEDLRFDMITEIDYSHRMLGASISVSSGSKNLRFRSYNQQRLRKLIGHVQHRMAESKNEQNKHATNQQQHLEQINQQLQAYLLAQYQQQEALRKQLADVQSVTGREIATPEPIKPGSQLSDYLFAQNLLRQYAPTVPEAQSTTDYGSPPHLFTAQQQPIGQPDQAEEPALADIYADGMKEIFGKRSEANTDPAPPSPEPIEISKVSNGAIFADNPLEINPMSIAYSKLPMVLRNRKFGRSLFHGSRQPANNAEAVFVKR